MHSDIATILNYLVTAYQVNPEAEISDLELQYELGLDAATTEECLASLAEQNLVAWDPLLSNKWLRLTDKGIALAPPSQKRPSL